jgi:hypothetical protein
MSEISGLNCFEVEQPEEIADTINNTIYMGFIVSYD